MMLNNEDKIEKFKENIEIIKLTLDEEDKLKKKIEILQNKKKKLREIHRSSENFNKKFEEIEKIYSQADDQFQKINAELKNKNIAKALKNSDVKTESVLKEIADKIRNDADSELSKFRECENKERKRQIQLVVKNEERHNKLQQQLQEQLKKAEKENCKRLITKFRKKLSLCIKCGRPSSSLKCSLCINFLEKDIDYKCPIFLKSMWEKTKKRAEVNKIYWNLSEEEYYELIKKPCYVCLTKIEDKKQKSGWLDRICNTKSLFDTKTGYIKNNVLPCCAECNRIRGTIPIELFISLIPPIRSYKELNIKDKDRVIEINSDWVLEEIDKELCNFKKTNANDIRKRVSVAKERELFVRKEREDFKKNYKAIKMSKKYHYHYLKKEEEIELFNYLERWDREIEIFFNKYFSDNKFSLKQKFNLFYEFVEQFKTGIPISLTTIDRDLSFEVTSELLDGIISMTKSDLGTEKMLSLGITQQEIRNWMK